MPKALYELIPTQAKRAHTYSFNPAKPVVYRRNYSLHCPWVRKPENMLRRCKLDDGGYIEVTDMRLTLLEDFKKQTFPLAQVKGMELAFKKLIGPLIIGSIVAPMALVSAFSSFIGFWAGMALFITGLLLLYYGVQGSYQVRVAFMDGTSYQFFVDEKTEELEGLVQYVNLMLPPAMLRRNIAGI